MDDTKTCETCSGTRFIRSGFSDSMIPCPVCPCSACGDTGCVVPCEVCKTTREARDERLREETLDGLLVALREAGVVVDRSHPEPFKSAVAAALDEARRERDEARQQCAEEHERYLGAVRMTGDENAKLREHVATLTEQVATLNAELAESESARESAEAAMESSNCDNIVLRNERDVAERGCVSLRAEREAERAAHEALRAELGEAEGRAAGLAAALADALTLERGERQQWARAREALRALAPPAPTADAMQARVEAAEAGSRKLVADVRAEHARRRTPDDSRLVVGAPTAEPKADAAPACSTCDGIRVARVLVQDEIDGPQRVELRPCPDCTGKAAR